MIQRIQTLYLLGTVGLLIAILSSKFIYTPEYIIKYTEYTPFLILSIATLAIAFFTIFLYRHRMFQIRMCTFNAILLLAFQGWVAYIFFNRQPNEIFSITAVFPIVCAILTIMAIRAIAKDEALVRAAASLRKYEKKRKKEAKKEKKN